MPENLQLDLQAIANDSKEIEERFYQYLSFGTGGMRGILGAGTNRMNVFTIRRVAEGLALYFASIGEDAKKRGVAIAYDTRHFSREFAEETAKVLGKHGIVTYVFDESRPTPELSFAVRHLGAFAGVVITASHNPKQYNGFKVYGADGGQLTPDAARTITNYMKEIADELLLEATDLDSLIEQGICRFVLTEIDRAYQEKLLSLREHTNVLEELKVVYSPLHGSGLKPMQDGLKAFGCHNVWIVEEQAIQDGSFPTVAYPNPEEREAFQLAIALGEKKDADLLMATDPDADRLGIAVKTNAGYELLTGNQLGALLLHYLLESKQSKHTLPENGVLLKTIVTSELGRAIAVKYGVETVDTLTGFKYIAEKIEEYDQTKEHTFLFGYEESYGYLIGDFVRDKDAVQTALVTAEMAGYYKKRGLSLREALEQLYREFGYYKEALQSITLEGKSGQEKIMSVLSNFRTHPPSSIAGVAVTTVEDYETGISYDASGRKSKLRLPKENVLKWLLEDGSWVCVRPSGTEPKCKFYFGVVRKDAVEAQNVLDSLQFDLIEKVENLLDTLKFSTL
ncbi:phospho-sugar mutase [Sporosarcina sp. PTS2304]|uniref:phospho-sugar mutase n=1 Tax=Sporosarcina sp. PTS2304 TaxID=2283194 RepID=UPI000E0DB332|nr:phospho-sugar mutase [Sporosarcina sp. PTS2304]AXI01238.1 phospho-sugar mutase [Sporosarcina sp. PTS2304]